MAKNDDKIDYGLNAAKLTEMTVVDFFDGSLRLFSAHSNVRGIPFIGDGFKEAQRKAMWGMLMKSGENGEPITVERISAACTDVTDYHHGIGSMQGTLINLAQDFAGSNNVNFLWHQGQFGSRRSHGAAAPRYLKTKMHENFRKIFKKEDDVILEQKNSGGTKIEPKYFIPLLPTILLNGAEGMGTGHATHIFCYSVKDLKDSILKVLDGKTLKDHSLIPSWNGFNGKVERDPITHQVIVTGDYQAVNTTEIRVTELPVGVQSDKYAEILFKLEDQGKIKSFKDASDDTGFDFIIKIPRASYYQTREEMIKMLKLQARDTENLTVWGPDGFIKRYESPEQLLKDFVAWRLERYEERRLRQIELTKVRMIELEEMIRFISFYLERTQEFRNLKKAEAIALLQANGFTLADWLMDQKIYNLTKDHIEGHQRKLDDEKKKLAALEVDSPEKMYRRELSELKL